MTMINGKAIPPGWPPDNSVNSMQWSGMNPEVARTAAWINYTATQAKANAGPGGFTQGAAGIDPATGKPFPASPTPGGQSMFYPIAGSMPGTQQGPRIYDPAAPPVSTGGNTDLSTYLAGKLGNNQGYSITTPLNPQTGTTQITRGGQSGYGDLGSIMKAISDARNKANAANEARYAQAGKLLQGYGKSYTNDINQAYQNDVGSTEQNAISRGIGNTTIRNSLLQGVAKTRNNALLNLQDRLAQQRVNLLQSKTDQAPDPYALAGLLQNATQGAYGSGGTLSSIAAALGLLR